MQFCRARNWVPSKALSFGWDIKLRLSATASTAEQSCSRAGQLPLVSSPICLHWVPLSFSGVICAVPKPSAKAPPQGQGTSVLTRAAVLQHGAGDSQLFYSLWCSSLILGITLSIGIVGELQKNPFVDTKSSGGIRKMWCLCYVSVVVTVSDRGSDSQDTSQRHPSKGETPGNFWIKHSVECHFSIF